MMFTTVMDFIWGKVITREGATQAQRRLAVAACVITNLSFLGFFKYYMFSAETLTSCWRWWARSRSASCAWCCPSASPSTPSIR